MLFVFCWQNLKAADIFYRKLCQVYAESIMSIRKWCRLFREGRTGHSSVVTDELVKNVNENQRLPIMSIV